MRYLIFMHYFLNLTRPSKSLLATLDVRPHSAFADCTSLRPIVSTSGVG